MCVWNTPRFVWIVISSSTAPKQGIDTRTRTCTHTFTEKFLHLKRRKEDFQGGANVIGQVPMSIISGWWYARCCCCQSTCQKCSFHQLDSHSAHTGQTSMFRTDMMAVYSIRLHSYKCIESGLVDVFCFCFPKLPLLICHLPFFQQQKDSYEGLKQSLRETDSRRN